MDQNTYLSTVPQQPCPVCSAPFTERRWRKFAGGEGNVRILSPGHSLLGSVVSPLVCYQCGFVQLFVNAEDFRKELSR